MQPKIDLELLASPFCFLSRQHDFNIWLKFRLHHQEPITVTTTGSIFDPAATFTKGRIEILDAETGEMVHFPTRTPTAEDSHASEESTLLTLEPGRGSYFFSSSTPQGKWHRYQLDISRLTPNRKYSVRYCGHGLTRWFPGRQPVQSDGQARSDPIEVNLLGNNAPSFTTRLALPPPPPVTASLSTSTPTCSLTGNPPFTISLDWKLANNGPRAICALQTRERGHNIGIEIRDPERKGRRIGPPSDRLSHHHEEEEEEEENEDGPPDEEVLFRLRHGTPIQQAYTFTVSPKQNGLVNADTWNLVSGKTYELTLRRSQWRWLYEDEVEDAVVRDEARLRARLAGEPRVQFQPGGRIEFRAT